MESKERHNDTIRCPVCGTKFKKVRWGCYFPLEGGDISNEEEKSEAPADETGTSCEKKNN